MMRDGSSKGVLYLQPEHSYTQHRVAQMRAKRNAREAKEFHVSFDTLVFSAEEVAEKINQKVRLTQPKVQAKVDRWSERTRRWINGYLRTSP